MIEEIKEFDDNFNESKFKTFIDNAFVQIHLAIMTKELDKIRHFVTNDVYEMLENKVSGLNNRNLIQMYDELNVKSTNITGYEVKDGRIFINVKLISRYMDYYLDLDGNYISGNNTSRVEKNNYLIFEKLIDSKEIGRVRKCPTCGSALDINSNGVCSFCKTVYDLENRGWVLSFMEVR